MKEVQISVRESGASGRGEDSVFLHNNAQKAQKEITFETSDLKKTIEVKG